MDNHHNIDRRELNMNHWLNDPLRNNYESEEDPVEKLFEFQRMSEVDVNEWKMFHDEHHM